MDLPKQLEIYQDRIQEVLLNILPKPHTDSSSLVEAMHYVVLNGGKRMRPLLVYATGKTLGVEPSLLDIPAAAIELIHAYSLVHDDLPAMDDDDLRRGQPTCHKAFDEATAILAGDALQTLAFESLLCHASSDLTAKQRLAMLQQLSHAAGVHGMVGGQALDLAATGQTLSHAQLNDMHKKKTGALIQACILLAIQATDLPMSDHKSICLQSFAENLGLAFQIQDDILDVESSTDVLGKTQGADYSLGKSTYPQVLGMTAAKATLEKVYADALDALRCFGDDADDLYHLAEFVIRRCY